jgi:predicted nucleic acid-binding protein
MIHLDTSALITALTGERTAALALRGFISEGSRLGMSAPVFYEWLRGPRTAEELSTQEILLPTRAVVGFGPEEAALAADLYRRMGRPRRREIDIAIAACALTHGAALWTLNPRDFSDIPALTLAS